MTRFQKLFVLGVAAIAPVVLSSFPTGAPPRVSGAPGDKNCITSGCHSGTVINNSSAIKLQFPNGLTYTPGVKQRLTVTANDSFALRYGFELTARLASDQESGQAGDLQPVDSSAFTECDGSGAPPPCSADKPVQFVTHSAPNPAGTWQVDWTPPATDVGNAVFYLAVNASANSGPSNKHIHLQSFTVTPQSTTTPACPGSGSDPEICGVANAASFLPTVGQGSWLTIAGGHLSTTSPGRAWASSDFTSNGSGLPLALDGTSVTVNGKPAYVEFISPTQVNVLAPSDSTAAGQGVPVVVSLNGQKSSEFQAKLAAVSPAFFTELPGNADNAKYLIAQHSSDFSRVGKPGLYPSDPSLTTPAKSGEIVVFYGTGFGATTPPQPEGQLVSQISPLNTSPVITVNGVQASVLFAALIPPFAGLYQFNVQLPANLPNGDVLVAAKLGDGTEAKKQCITIANPGSTDTPVTCAP